MLLNDLILNHQLGLFMADCLECSVSMMSSVKPTQSTRGSIQRHNIYIRIYRPTVYIYNMYIGNCVCCSKMYVG